MPPAAKLLLLSALPPPTPPTPLCASRMDANIAFMRSGGYAISGRLAEVEKPVLVLW